MSFIAWTEIEALYNVRKYTAAHPEILNGDSVVHYQPKVKLHGTNAAVQCLANGTIVAQSRTNIITPQNDNAGFARWVHENEKFWKTEPYTPRNNMILFGEWIGPGIQKGVAVSEIPKKCFAVFAARSMDPSMPDYLVTEPKHLAQMVEGIPDTYVLPWYRTSFRDPILGECTAEVVSIIDWSRSAEELIAQAERINKWVHAVEDNDPWVEATFGIKGTGEGLVFYPVSEKHLGLTNFNNLVFKAKGEKHKNIKTAAPAQVNPEIASSVAAFVDMVLTPARLEQGVRAVAGELNFDARNTGNFVKWITEDVKKETQDELEASNLSWKDVQKPLTEKARGWFLAQARV